MAPHIVIVEDDHLQAGPLEEYLRSDISDASVVTFGTEEEFRQNLPHLRQHPPDVVVMDVMLRWNHPSAGAARPPDDVVEGRYFRAGLRCAALLRAEEGLHDVPVVLYTILERSDLERDGKALPANSVYVGKNSDLEALSRSVRAQLAGSRSQRDERARSRGRE
jgi:DNA-binding NarL/FixJ family response regulator